MKAEQRKELETNTLADKMGRAMQRVKTSPRRTFVIYALVAAAILVAGWLGWNWWVNQSVEQSFQWIRFYDGSGAQIEALAEQQETKDTPAGKAARFQLLWHFYWNSGIKMVGIDPAGSMDRLRLVAQEYNKLAVECKDDPVFEPQALLGRAVATESLAVQEPKQLEDAKKLYKELADHEKYSTSAEGRFAKQRYDILSDKAKGAALAAEYDELKGLLKIEDRRILPGKMKGQFPPLK